MMKRRKVISMALVVLMMAAVLSACVTHADNPVRREIVRTVRDLPPVEKTMTIYAIGRRLSMYPICCRSNAILCSMEK
jgi:hypothetical protein